MPKNKSLAICVVIFLIYVYYIYISHPKLKILEYNALRHRFKTGDIILFHGLDNINPIFIGCYYGHVGIIYVDPDSSKQYLFEAFSPNNMKFCPPSIKNGIGLVDLEHRLNSYRGYSFYKELAYPVSIDIQRGFKEFINYSIKNMQYREEVILNAIEKIFFNQCLYNGTNCGELVWLSLIKLGLINCSVLENNRILHLHTVCNINEVNNNFYYSPVYVLSNYLKIHA